MSARITLCCVLALLLLPCQAVVAFTTVINAPPDSLAPLLQGNVYVVGQGTQVNVSESRDFWEHSFFVSGGELNVGSSTGSGVGVMVSDGGVVNVQDSNLYFMEVEDGGAANLDSVGYAAPITTFPGGQLSAKDSHLTVLDMRGGEADLHEVKVDLFGVNGNPGEGPAHARVYGGELPVGDRSLAVGNLGTLEIHSVDYIEPAIWVVDPQGTLDVVGYDFAIDGASIDGLVQGEPYPIPEADFTLTGRYADGSPFEMLVSDSDPGFDLQGLHVESFGTVQVTLSVPEPTGLVLSSGVLALSAASRSRRVLVRRRACAERSSLSPLRP